MWQCEMGCLVSSQLVFETYINWVAEDTRIWERIVNSGGRIVIFGWTILVEKCAFGQFDCIEDYGVLFSYSSVGILTQPCRLNIYNGKV